MVRPLSLVFGGAVLAVLATGPGAGSAQGSAQSGNMVCLTAERDWSSMRTSATSAQLRAFQARVPSDCSALRQGVAARIHELDTPRPPPPPAPPPPVGNLAAADCGGEVLSAPAGSTLPLGGLAAILNEGNGADCLIAPQGRTLVVDVRVCPQAAAGVSTVRLKRTTRDIRGSTGSYAPITIYAAGPDGRNFRPIMTRNSFGDAPLHADGVVPNVAFLRVEVVVRDPRYQQGLCSIDVR